MKSVNVIKVDSNRPGARCSREANKGYKMHSQLALSVNAALVHLTPNAGNKQQKANKRNFRYGQKGQNLSSQLNRREWQAGNFLRPACLPLKGYGDANPASVENVDNHACLVLLCVDFSNGARRRWTLRCHFMNTGQAIRAIPLERMKVQWFGLHLRDRKIRIAP